MVAANGPTIWRNGPLLGTAIHVEIPWRVATLVACIGVAYFYPILTLIHTMRYDSPLAYLGLVPLFALAIGCWQYRQGRIANRPFGTKDVVVGSTFIVIALVMSLGLPAISTSSASSRHRDLFTLLTYAAENRLDLLSLPIFAAGCVVVLYGTVALRALWPSLTYGFLVWPIPYDGLLGHALPWLSDRTARFVAVASHLLPLGATADPSDGTLFVLSTPNGPQELSIGSACSGFNSVVAWVLIGMAVAIVVRKIGSRRYNLQAGGRLALWFLTGAVAVYLINIGRILLLFTIVHRFGINTTYESVHAAIGSALFTLTVIGMIALLARFGLGLPAERVSQGEATPRVVTAVPDARAPFIALAITLLAIGILLRIGILRLLLMLAAVYLIFCLYLLFAFISGRLPSQFVASKRFRLRLDSFVKVALTIGMFAVLIGGLLGMLHLKRIRAEAIPALGWRIDEEQPAILTDSVRYGLVIALIIVAGILTRKLIARLDARSTDHAETSPLIPWWSRDALIAGILIGSTATMALTTVTLASFRATVTTPDTLLVRDFDAAPPDIPDATWTFVQAYDWPKQSLGRSATYRRFRYDTGDGQLLWVDVVTTQDADALAQHNVRSCYNFHGYVTEGASTLDIGNGATANLVNYLKPDVGEAWTTLYWEMRVARDGQTFFQRIVILSNLDIPSGETVTAPHFSANNAYVQVRATQLFDGLVTGNGA